MLNSWLDIPSEPLFLTVGFFDGYHLGHQRLIQELKEEAKRFGVRSAILTFTNHPSYIFSPDSPRPLITPTSERKRLLLSSGVDILFGVPFTEAFASLSAKEFLSYFNLASLVLGHDARIGKERKGDRSHLLKISEARGFTLTYLQPVIIDGEIVSSSKLREKILAGDFATASRWMGRDYSLSLPVTKGLGVGKGLGFSTANMDVSGLVVPPTGVYITSVIVKGARYKAVANLGTAPTVRSDNTLQLEVHLLDQEIDLTGETIEVVFHKFLREERRFESLTALREQIAKDSKAARDTL